MRCENEIKTIHNTRFRGLQWLMNLSILIWFENEVGWMFSNYWKKRWQWMLGH